MSGSRLALAQNLGIFRSMKFVMAMLAHAVIAFMIGWGILAAVRPEGKPWLLLAAIAAYLVLFWRNGCSEEH